MSNVTLADEFPGPFVAGYATEINVVVTRELDDVESAVDLSDSRWTVRLRALQDDSDTAYVVDVVLAKSAAAAPGGAANGYVEDQVFAGTTPYPRSLRWRIVLVDTTVTMTGTKTGKWEVVVMEWRAPIGDAP